MKNAPKGNVKGKMPSMPGHPVGEHGMKNAPKGGMSGATPSSTKKTGGRGIKTGAATKIGGRYRG